MADPRTFVLIGNFTDNITPALAKINKSLEQVKANLESVSKSTKPLQKDFKELADLSNTFSKSLKNQTSDIREITRAMKEMRAEMGRVNRAYRAAGRNRNVVSPPPPPRPPRTPRGAAAALPPPRGPGGGPPSGPRGGRGGGRQSVLGDVISGTLISNAIVQGFQVGVGILQQGMAVAFGAFAERTRDQLEDIGAAGGIFSASKFANIPGFPKTFQGAMEMQDKINKDMATIASNLPGTTHDYVQNSRRLVDTTAQIMARDMKGFTKLATELTGKMNVSAEEAFRVVNVEVAKATTMLEKLNPAKTVVPMTQLVEDMLKDEKVTIGGLRRYVSFRRSTTFEAALQRNIDELNKTGAGTAARLKMIIKTLKEAVPPEMVTAFQASVAGVVEGFKSALMDPDVGIFGLSRVLTFTVKKFDRETGKYIGREFTNFFKMFSEVFGNIGNLINNTIMPGLQALYQPFDAIARQFEKLREFSFKIYERQQEYTTYFADKAAEYGMRREDFKVFEKGGISAMMDILQGFGMLSDAKYKKYVDKMKAKGTPEQVAQSMKEIYADLIPTIFESPFFKDLGKTLGRALAEVFKEIAKIMKALLSGNYGTNEFLKAFNDAGGMNAVNEILMYVAEMIGKVLLKIVEVYFGALFKAIGSGNFAAAGVLGALGLVFGGPAIAGIKVIATGMKMLVNAFKILLASRVIPTKVTDMGSVITNPRRMLPGTAVAPVPGGALAPAGAGGGVGGAAARFAGPAAAAASFIIFDTQILQFAEWLRVQGDKLQNMKNVAANGLAVLVKGLSALLEGLTNTFKGAFDMIVGLFTGDIEKVKQGFVRMMNGIVQALGGVVVSVIGIATTVGGGIVQAVKSIFQAIWEGVMGIKNEADNPPAKPLGQTRFNKKTNKSEILTDKGWIVNPAYGEAKGTGAAFKGTLGSALNYEMKNKPAGSNLVVANSSEMVIPAAGGYGVQDLMETLRFGFSTLVNVYRESQQKQSQDFSKINQTLIYNQQQTNARLTKLETKFSTPAMGGLGGGSIGGGVDSFTGMAQRYGLQMTSGYRPGDPGWHGANRARDYSNGTGPTPQMMQFAQFMASNYGANLKELIYTPLGFSIKNGQRVAPYATAGHYNHVHVAYALGAGSPAFFGSQSAAVDWERSMMPGSVKVGSITSNSREGIGGNTFGNINVTVNAGSTSDPDTLASLVALKIGEAVADARAASIFV
jgi:uncharacterized protein YoxC